MKELTDSQLIMKSLAGLLVLITLYCSDEKLWPDYCSKDKDYAEAACQLSNNCRKVYLKEINI